MLMEKRKIKISVMRISLVLLVAVCVTAHLSAGLSAKYTSGMEGSDNVSVAKFVGGTVSFPGGVASSYLIGSATNAGYHAFVAESEVSFGACEVSRKFTLTVTCDSSTTFKMPSEQVYTLYSCGGSMAFSAGDVGMSNITPTSGKAYVGIANVTDGMASYSWSEAAVSSDGMTLTAVADKPVSMNAERYSVKVLYFENIDTVGAEFSENANLSYSLNCEQVD